MLRVEQTQLGAIGAHLIQNGVEGVSHTVATMGPASVVPPAGADSVSIMAGAIFSAYGVMATVQDMFGQQMITLFGATVLESAAQYGVADAAGSAIVGL